MSNAAAIASLGKFAASLRQLPTTVAIKVASAAAPVLTDLAQATFAAGQDAYGDSWSPGAKGQRVDLQESGALGRTIRYVATGTKLRVALGVNYAKYQVGRRPVTPRPGAPLPVAYSQRLAALTAEAVRAELAP